jgi:phosphatidate cytidylyltransferase
MKRVLTTLALIPFAIFSIFFAPQWLFVIIAIAMALLCYVEMSNIVAAHGIEAPGVFGALAGLLLFVDIGLVRLVAIFALIRAIRLRVLSQALASASAMALTAVYIFGAWRCAIDLRAVSPYWLLFALAINWVGDIAAYYVGRAIGQHKLAASISPGKTVEGAVGSMVAAIVFGILFRHYLMPAIPLHWILALAIAGNIAGQTGDLVESAMKRGAGMKDSGTWLPGHGGFLDRLDSSLFTMPVIWMLLQVKGSFPN